MTQLDSQFHAAVAGGRVTAPVKRLATQLWRTRKYREDNSSAAQPSSLWFLQTQRPQAQKDCIKCIDDLGAASSGRFLEEERLWQVRHNTLAAICSVLDQANSLATAESAVSGVVHRRYVAIYVFLPRAMLTNTSEIFSWLWNTRDVSVFHPPRLPFWFSSKLRRMIRL